jgi:hypothetical protein
MNAEEKFTLEDAYRYQQDGLLDLEKAIRAASVLLDRSCDIENEEIDVDRETLSGLSVIMKRCARKIARERQTQKGASAA